MRELKYFIDKELSVFVNLKNAKSIYIFDSYTKLRGVKL